MLNQVFLVLTGSLFLLTLSCTQKIITQVDQRQPAAFSIQSALNLSQSKITVSKLNLMIMQFEGDNFDCNFLEKRQESFNGQVYTKYNITSPAQLNCPQVLATKQKCPWVVKKALWSADDELGFQNFVSALGKSKCSSADRCLSASTNILLSEEDMFNTYYTDCADLPYYLRAYYAYKKGLPVSFVMQIRPVPLDENQQKTREAVMADLNAKGLFSELEAKKSAWSDTRYSINGNMPTGQLDIPNTS